MNAENFKVDLLPNSGERNSTVFVLGPTGSGKSTLLANLARQRPRLIVIDSKKDYAPEFFGNLCVATPDFARFIECLNNGDERIIFELHRHSENREEILSVLFQHIFEFQLLNFKTLPPLTICLDELDSYVSSRSAPPGVELVIKQGRSVRIEKLFGGQWFADIPAWARDTFTEIYTFAHYDRNGLNRLEQFGFDSEQVKTLPAFVCAYVGKGENKTVRLLAGN